MTAYHLQSSTADFPTKYREVGDVVQTMIYLMHAVLGENVTQFSRTTEREVCKKDNDFIGKIMTMN